MDTLVTAAWLFENLRTVKIVDASWRMPGNPPARDDYNRRHIPGAVFFDIDQIAEPVTDLPHMLFSPKPFAAAIGEMGITSTDHVICYDDQGLFSAARAWWTFQAMGHERVSVLDGGLPQWLAAGNSVTDETVITKAVAYSVPNELSLVADHRDVLDSLQTGAAQVVDARPADRFRGLAPEPRAGLISGAMPGARNIPYASLLTDNGRLKAKSDLVSVFKSAGVDTNLPIITTCGSGITAAIVALALARLGHKRWSLYDGSWAEWGKKSNDRVAYPVTRENG